jgi:LCP family protein required for cell wall assembly
MSNKRLRERYYQQEVPENKDHRKTLLIIILVLLGLAVIGFSIFSLFDDILEPPTETLYAGIGGYVNDPGVYPVTENTYLYELIILAKGLTEVADISRYDTDTKIIPFEVYCIPRVPEKVYKKPSKPILPAVVVPKPVVFEEPERINIVYAGLPRTFLLISVYPQNNFISVTHIPWYTRVTPDFEYPRTLYEVYLTGGIPFLLRSIKRVTGVTIDHYFTQKRPSWIKFIDYLGGIEVDVPADFAKEFHLREGKQTINGLLSWQYISYISKSKRRSDAWITGSGYRIKRQKEFMFSMMKKFKDMNFMSQGEVLKGILRDADTNFKADDVVSLAYKVRKMKKMKTEFLTLPGIIKDLDGRRMWITDLNDYKTEHSDLVKEILKLQEPVKSEKGGFGGK